LSAIQTRALRKVYGRGAKRVEALVGLDLDVEPGSIFGLLGPNGAGKTTLVKMLLGIIRPTAGSATLLGRDIRKPASRTSVGFLPEGHRFPRYLTAERALWLYGQLSGYRGGDLAREIDEKLLLVGLADWKKRKIKTFSKGMLQRLGLAQAMLGTPQLIFLDEPTDGVDPVGRVAVRDILTNLKSRGTTIFLNSHLLQEVEQVCDRVAILNRGRVIREGTVDQLTAGQRGLVYEYQVTPLTVDQVKALSEDPRITVQGTKVLVALDDESQLEAVTDRLREMKISVRGLSEARQSLEDVFMDLIVGEEAQS